MNRTGRRPAALCILLALLAPAAAPVARADDGRGREANKVDVLLKPDAPTVTLKGQVTGGSSVEYRLAARAGQTLAVTLDTASKTLTFNIGVTNSDTMLFMGRGAGQGSGQGSGTQFKGEVPLDAIYVVDVHLVRPAPRRGESADYTLAITLEGGTAQPARTADAKGATKGAASAGLVSPAATSPGTTPPVPKADFADGYGGGPDYWAVSGLAKGDTLSLRDGPSARDKLLYRLAEGAVLRNLGCRPVHGARWCKVQLLGDANAAGWVNGRYLREASSPQVVEGDAKVPGTPFNATGTLPCRIAGEPQANCAFGVIRNGREESTLEITLPGAIKRTLVWRKGVVSATDGSPVTTAREGDDIIVTVKGAERFTVPGVVISGD